MPNKVMVAEHIDESGIRVLKDSNRVEVVYYDDHPVSDSELSETLQETVAAIVRIKHFNRDMIQNAPHLKIIAKHGVGYDNIDVAAATERKIPVITTAEANSDAVADHAMGLMLALSRRLLQADADLKSGRFSRREHYMGVELGGKTIGIIGLGRIGSRVAKRCSQGFGMRVLTYDPYISDAYAGTHHAERFDQLEALLKISDYVTVHTPLNDETRDMIDAKALRAMKSDAFIISTARGGIINETALHEALSQQWILGAGLDVFVEEPARPGQTPLLSLGNVLVTPHVAGATREAARKMATHAAEGILEVLGGRRPRSLINPEIYD